MALETNTAHQARVLSQERKREAAGRASRVDRVLAATLATRLLPQAGQQRIAGLPDIAGAQSEHQVALAGSTPKRLHAALHSADVFGAAMAELPDALGQGFGGHARDGLFRSGVDIQHEDAVRLVEGAPEFVHQVHGPAVAVRLEQHVNAAETAQPRGRQGGADFGGMMAVVVDDRDAALLAADLKAPVHAVKGLERPADHIRRYI